MPDIHHMTLQLMKTLFFLLVAEVSATIPGWSQAVHAPTQLSVDSLAAQYLADTTRPGLAVGILGPGSDQTYYYGRSNRVGSRPIDAKSLFEIGSVTKLYTSFILANLEYDGRLKRGDLLAADLPATAASNGTWAKKITLRHLATHTSGLPAFESTRALMKYPGFDENDPYKVCDSAFVFRALSSVDSLPGLGQVKYSNLGMALLAYALAQKGGASYEGLLTHYVRNGLGLHDVYLNLFPAESGRVAVPHRGSEAMPLIELHAFAPAGGIKTTLPNLLAFMRAHLRPTSRRAKWISANTLHNQLPPGQDPVGLGWGIYTVAGQTVYFHIGGTYGSSSILMLAPAKNVGVAMLSNSATDQLTGYAISVMKQLVK